MSKVEDNAFYMQKRIVITGRTSEETTQKKKCKRSSIVLNIIKMFKHENMVRPRKNNSSSTWISSYQNQRVSNKTSIFRIGDTQMFSGSYNEDYHLSIRSETQGHSKHAVHKSMKNKALETVEGYCGKTTLHGLRYVGDTSITIGERIFWLLAFCCAVAFAAYFISTIYIKWETNPVIISFSPTTVSLESIPFPAVTICNMNQAKKDEAEKILIDGPELYRKLLDDYCASTNSAANFSAEEAASSKWDNVFKFILKVGQSCSEMIKVCKWRRQTVDCNQIFNADLTDEGLCCSFNRLPNELIFRKSKELAILNITRPDEVADWTPENGYMESASAYAIPWRPTGAGAHLGLSVTLDAQVYNYYCSSTQSVGFKVLLSNPIETPKISDFGFLITPGFESRIIIKPTVTEATRSLRNIPISKRRCFFMNEYYLQFYRTYTERNCKLECQANYTLKMCNCVPYFLPKNSNTKVCGRQQEICSNAAKDQMETLLENGTHCNCLPACYGLSYEKSSSYAKMSSKLKVREEAIGNKSTEYFLENMAIVHFFFNEAKFVKRLKSELYGFSEFLSNTGGLLGLFLGFSFLSAVELFYYVSLKVCCTLIKKQKHNHVRESDDTSKEIVFPYLK